MTRVPRYPSTRVIAYPRTLPATPRAIHERPCQHCPSAHFPPDPEALDLESLPFEQRIRHVFPCAWNGSALCRGVCDRMGVGPEHLDDPDLGRAE